MANDLTLRQNHGFPTFSLNIALRGISPPTDETPSTSVKIYFRFEDAPDDEPVLLGQVTAGESLKIPFDPKGRTMRFFANPLSEDGERLFTDYAAMSQTTFTPTPLPEDDAPRMVASESMTAPCLINVWDDSGTPKVRKANATNNTKPADGFIINSVTAGDFVKPFFDGKIPGYTTLTIGATFFLSTTGGGITTTAPISSGSIQQIVGRSINATTLQFEPQPPIEKT